MVSQSVVLLMLLRSAVIVLGTTRVDEEVEDHHHHVVLVKVKKRKTALYREVKEDHRKVNPVVTDQDVEAAVADSVEALCEGVTWVPLETRTRAIPTKTVTLRCVEEGHHAVSSAVIFAGDAVAVGAPRLKTARARAIRVAKGDRGRATAGGDHPGLVIAPLLAKEMMPPLRAKIQQLHR